MEQAAVAEKVRAGICPECGAGPFKVLATHTWGKHRISSRALRDMAGMTYVESIIAPETRERLSELAKERGNEHLGDARKRKTRRGISEAGRRAMAENALKAPRDRERKPHPCTVCGAIIPMASITRRTCSDECEREARSRNAIATHTGRNIGPDEAARKAVSLLKSNERYRQEHPCPVCGATVPTARTVTCSPECGREQTRRVNRGDAEPAGRKARAARGLPVPPPREVQR